LIDSDIYTFRWSSICLNGLQLTTNFVFLVYRHSLFRNSDAGNISPFSADSLKLECLSKTWEIKQFMILFQEKKFKLKKQMDQQLIKKQINDITFVHQLDLLMVRFSRDLYSGLFAQLSISRARKISEGCESRDDCSFCSFLKQT
jgi:hypothetical protein